jgi:hypothetical protein
VLTHVLLRLVIEGAWNPQGGTHRDLIGGLVEGLSSGHGGLLL